MCSRHAHVLSANTILFQPDFCRCLHKFYCKSPKTILHLPIIGRVAQVPLSVHSPVPELEYFVKDAMH